ncbi:MAG: hypothetical protein A2Y64_03210 [Candidatus Coatesbacteria bacterium RBG_13_66_14]|uniref:Uncharacterized protein n=1 Tax=Candidatus Coatesbacteria bacterium RBG_13_66_14 TaxID=1817816 RepID=A0A1F5EYZ8_9BACT|nr:MAG: hypothetical protein A2Y64_03210 [Candidatus Coatesbacteria bacterium RBG_13_66_14]
MIKIPEARSWRWLQAPPTRTAYLSSSRQPGRVLRVSTSRGGEGEREPSGSASQARRSSADQARETVATPHIRPRKFNAVRSAARIERRQPFTTAKTVPPSSRSPSV